MTRVYLPKEVVNQNNMKKSRFCKVCNIELNPDNSRKHTRLCLPHFREYAMSLYYKHREKRLKKTKEWSKTEKGKEVARISRMKTYYKNPEKNNARNKVRLAVKAGKIIKPAMCELYNPHPEIPCFGRLEAHHYTGYDGEHWKDIQWLCSKHHALKHTITSLKSK